ncbi:MAG: hypothetical protein Q9227_007649 [Pyrenula ochraceoflavens]
MPSQGNASNKDSTESSDSWNPTCKEFLDSIQKQVQHQEYEVKLVRSELVLKKRRVYQDVEVDVKIAKGVVERWEKKKIEIAKILTDLKQFEEKNHKKFNPSFHEVVFTLNSFCDMLEKTLRIARQDLESCSKTKEQSRPEHIERMTFSLTKEIRLQEDELARLGKMREFLNDIYKIRALAEKRPLEYNPLDTLDTAPREEPTLAALVENIKE